MKVLVTGGTGFLGKAIVERLVARGDQVRVLARGVTGTGRQAATAHSVAARTTTSARRARRRLRRVVSSVSSNVSRPTIGISEPRLISARVVS